MGAFGGLLSYIANIVQRLSGLESFKSNISIPFSVVGGINENMIQQVAAAGANTVAVGAACPNPSPGEVARQWWEKIASVPLVS